MSFDWNVAWARVRRRGRQGALVAIVAAALSHVLFTCAFVSRDTIPDANGLIVWLWLLMLPAVGALNSRVIRPRLVGCRRRSVVGAVVVAVLAGVVLSMALPLPTPHAGRLHRLRVIATGHGDGPTARELVLVGSLDLDGSPFVAPGDFQQDGNWVLREGRDYLVADRAADEPAELRWEGVLPANAGGPLLLRLVADRGMGMVEVVWDGHPRVVDLREEEAPPGGILKHVALELPDQSTAARCLHAASGGVGLGFVLFLAVVVIAMPRPVPSAGRPLPRRWLVLAHAAPMLCVWTFYVLSHWPGMLSHDSLGEWLAVVNRRWNDKPAMQQFTIWAITRLWQSPGAVILTYAAAFSLLIGWIVVRFRSFGLSGKAAWAISLVVALFPMHVRVVSWLLNDMPFTIAMLAVSALLLEVVESRGGWLDSRRSNWAVLAVVGALTALYRHTGLFAILATYGVLLLGYRCSTRRILASLVLCMALVGLVKGPVYRMLDVERYGANSKGMLVGALFVWPIMAHVDEGTALSDEDAGVLRDWDPGDAGFWGEYHNGRQVNPCWLDTFPADKAERFDWRIVRVWANLTRRAPMVTLDHYLEVSSFVWGINTGRIETFSFMDDRHLLRDNLPPPYATGDERLVPFGPGWGRSLVHVMDRHAWFFWRPAPWFYLLLFAYAVGIVRNGRWDLMIILAPQVANAAIIAAAANTPEVRYLYPLIVSSQVFVPFFAMKRSGHAAPSDMRRPADDARVRADEGGVRVRQAGPQAGAQAFGGTASGRSPG